MTRIRGTVVLKGLALKPAAPLATSGSCDGEASLSKGGARKWAHELLHSRETGWVGMAKDEGILWSVGLFDRHTKRSQHSAAWPEGPFAAFSPFLPSLPSSPFPPLILLCSSVTFAHFWLAYWICHLFSSPSGQLLRAAAQIITSDYIHAENYLCEGTCQHSTRKSLWEIYVGISFLTDTYNETHTIYQWHLMLKRDNKMFAVHIFLDPIKGVTFSLGFSSQSPTPSHFSWNWCEAGPF